MSSSFRFSHPRLSLLLAVFVFAAGSFGAAPLRAQVIGFEDGTIPADWTEPSGSDAPWTITSATSSSGTYSIGSNDINDNETAEIAVTVEVPKDSVITFDYRVSSEDGFDFFRFYVDGTQKLEDSGDSGWVTSGQIAVSAGTHTFRWAYEKDVSVSDFSDKAWIDNVALPTTGPPSSVFAQAASVGDVQLDWTAVGGADEYRIYRDTAPIDSSAGPSSYTPLNSVSAGTTTYVDGSATSGTTYYYRITTVSGGTETGFSSQASITPGHAATALQPKSGAPGASIRVYGRGFDPTASNNTVSFGGTQATVTAARPSVLTVEVPSGLQSDVPVTVDTGPERDTVGTSFQVLAANTGTRAFVDTTFPGVSESATAWSDYDDDGDQDVVVAGDGTTTLYRNDGGLYNFTPANVGLTGVLNGVSVDWGDYDGDDDVDLVVAGGLTTTIYKNDGSGALNSISAGLEGVNRGDAEWGDYDNDGDLDLIVIGNNNSDVTTTQLYRNDGGGVFTPVSDNLPDLQEGSVDWGDYNDDGLLDLIVTGIDGALTPRAQIYRGDGDSTFTAVGAGLTGVSRGAAKWSDYDQDGDLDLIVSGGNEGTPTTELYRNDGGGAFTPVSAGLVDVRNSTADWGDYDGDGDPDLVLAGKAGSDTTAVLYRNDGMGDFSAVNTGITGVTNGSVDWADQNGNGVLDLIVGGTDASNTASVRVYESRSAPPPPPTGLAASASADSVEIGWDAVGASDLTEYRIYRDTAPIDSLNYASATPLDTVAAGTTTYTDASVTTGTPYYYRVTAADAGTESGASNEASGTPAFRISGFVPGAGTPTTAVRLFSSGFSPTGNTVSFVDTTGADLSATITRTQGTALTVEVPSGLGAPARIAVERNDGATDTTTSRFTPVGAGIGDRSFSAVSLGLPDLQEGDVDWGDFNGDGALDVAVSGQEGLGIVTAIYRNDGNGTFTALNAGLTDLDLGSVDWVDYDRDEDLDLLVTGEDGSDNPQTILYRNDGNGNFTEVSAGLMDVTSSDAAWGDYNGDGYRDLVLAGNDGSNRTTVLYRNSGDGSFTPVAAGLTGVEGPGVDWADYDGDGALDLLVAGQSDAGPSATIYHNDGDGQFSVAGANLTGVKTGTTGVEAGVGAEWGDYDADGDPDLVLTGLDENSDEIATIYRNDGGGTFTAVEAGLTGVQMGDATWGDYDGDGDLDLVIAGLGPSNKATTLYRNEGNDTFTERDARLAGVNYSTVSWGDYDADGALDLIALGQDQNNNTATAVYQSKPEPAPPTGLSAVAYADSVVLDWEEVNASDLNNYLVYRSTAPIDSAAGPSTLTALAPSDTSSYTDTGVSTGTTYYYRVTAVDAGTSESGYSSEANPTPAFRITNFQPSSGVAGDSVRVYSNGFTASINAVSFLDPSGTSTAATPGTVTSTALTVEVPSGVSGPARIVVERGDGTRDTTASRFTPISSGIGDRSFDLTSTAIDSVADSDAAWGDYDQDGDLDLLIAGGNASGDFAFAAIYRNDGGSFTNINAGLPQIKFGASVDWGDLDGDGDLDVVISGKKADDSVVTQVYRNEGSDTFTQVGAGIPGVWVGAVVWGDYNDDGFQDLLVTGQNPNEGRLSRIYRNDGTGGFRSIGAGLTALGSSTADWGDYDNDGDLDIILAGSDGFDSQAYLYRNDGGGAFESVQTNVPGIQRGEVEWGDYNGDGRLDLVLAGRESISGVDLLSAVYRNDGGGTFTALNEGLGDVYRGEVDWGDYDGDGDLDLVVAGVDSALNTQTAIYRNDGGDTFTRRKQTLIGGRSDGSADWVDYDGDGTLDLFLTGGGTAGVLSNLYQSQPEPNVPRKLQAVALADSVVLDWETVTAGDLQEYRIYRETAPIDSAAGPSSLTALATVGPNRTSYADASVTAGDTLYYRVTAVDTTGAESGFSDESSGVPGFRLAGVSPTSGTPGTAVRVSGNGFDLAATNNTASFIDTTGTATSATVIAADTTVLTVDVPNGLEGASRVAVERSDGSADTTGVRFTPIGRNIGDRTFANTGFNFAGVEEGDMAWADYDDDGDLDVVVTGDTPITTLYRNDDSTFTAVGAGLADVGNSDVAWADYDNDGDADLALMGGGSANKVTTVYENKGNGTFEPVGLGLEGIENGGIDWADYNGDGRPDLAVVGSDTNFDPAAKIYRNEGDTTFTAIEAGITGAEDAELQWGDYNGDGRPDLAVMGSGPSGRQTTIYRNAGGGTFTPIGAGLPGLIDGDLDWGDYDNDGDLDLVVVGEQDGFTAYETAIYRNDGNDTFTALGAGLEDVGDESQVDWGDYNGDGRLDLAVTGQDENSNVTTAVYRNRGSGTFTAINAAVQDVTRSSLAWGDYDGDGALDLLVTGQYPTGLESTATATFLYRSRPNPPAVSAVNARPAEEQRTRVRWDSLAASDLAKYYVYRSTASITASPSDLSPFDSVAVGKTTYTDTSIAQPGATYYYRITALDTTRVESRTFSNEATTVPKPAAGTLYVDQSASGANDGSSWPDAFVHLQDAADSVNANPYTDYDIRVAEGVYYPDADKDGDHVADDTTEAFRIAVDDVSLLGGYPAGGGTETERDPENNLTVLSGDITQDDMDLGGNGVTSSPADIVGANANTVLYLDGNTFQPGRERIGSNTLISGVTITGGQARGGSGGSDGDGGNVTPGNEVSPQDGVVQPSGAAARAGGGVFCVNQPSPAKKTSCSPVFREITIRGNRAVNGGGLAAVGYSQTNPSFREVSFVANRADSVGGAAVVTTRSVTVDTVTTAGIANPHFVEATFQDNQARAGAAVALDVRTEGRANAQFVSTAFRNNQASQRGGAVLLTGAGDGQLRPSFTNALFYRNQAGDEGGGVFAIGKTGATVAPTFTNATFVANRAAVVGGALYSDGRGGTVAPELANTILWANEAGAGGRQVASNDVTPVFRHSLVEGSGGSTNWTSDLGTDEGGNIDTNPLLVDTSATDFRPQEDAPVLDAGLNSALPPDSTDLNANGDSTEVLPRDLADSTRVADANGDGTATVNMGAYEAVGPDLTPLTAPTTVAITAFTDSLRVGWAAVGDGDLAKYRIYRDTVAIDSAAGPAAYTPYDSVGAGTTMIADSAVVADSTYHYRVTSVDNAGNESSFSGEVQAQPAAALTVWPGDTDNDGVVNQNDVLPLGFQWGQTGPARDSTGCAFQGRAAAAWPTQAATYADANGDGVVDQGDVLCIGLNWGDSTSTNKSMPLYAGSSPATTSLTAPDTPDGAPQEPRDRGEEARRRVLKTPSGQPIQTDDAPVAKKASERGRLELDAPSEPDSVLWVAVRAKELASAGGAAFEVSYPASKATVETVEMTDWFGEEALAQSHVDAKAGVVGIGLANADSVRSGSGVLARLKVRLSEKTTDPVQFQLREAQVGQGPGRIASLDAGDGVQVRRVPETFKLYGNYPNPIRKRTTIRYDLPSERHVKLRVYDVLGRHVATLVDETQKPGQKTVTWQAAEMASGVYVYRLTAGDRSDTGKMTVVR